MSNKVSKIIVFFYTFTAVSIFFSIWLGYFWRNSYFISFASLAVAYYLYKKFKYEFEIPLNVYLLTFVMLILVAHPLLFLTPYYPASADALHTTIVTTIGDNIPDTLAPYTDLKLVYQIGFHLFAKIFTDFFPDVPDYLVLWFFAVVFATLQVILVYQLGKTFFGSKTYGEWAALLLIGTKSVFQFMFFGVWPMLLAMDLFLLFFILFIEGNKLYYLLLPAIFIVHPFGGLMSLFILGVYSVYYKRIKNFLFLFPPLILIAPFIFKTYSVYAASLLSEGTRTFGMSFDNFANLLFPTMPLWFGIVPSIFAILSIFLIIQNRLFDNRILFILTVLVTSIVAFFSLHFIGYMHAERVFVIIMFSGLLLASVSLEISGMNSHKLKNIFRVLIVFACILVFLNSSELTRIRHGSKISAEEAQLAYEFHDFDSTPTTTLFLSPGKAWMAHISNKIPYDVKSGWFVPYTESQVVRDKGYEEMNQRREKWEEIYNNGCVDCIYELNVTYVVINKNYSNITLREEPVLQYRYFDVYKK